MIELLKDMRSNPHQFIREINSTRRVPPISPLTPNNDTKKSNRSNIAIRSPNHPGSQIIDELLNVIMIRLGKEKTDGKINTNDREVVKPYLLGFLEKYKDVIDSGDNIAVKNFIVDNVVEMYNSAQPKRDNPPPPTLNRAPEKDGVTPVLSDSVKFDELLEKLKVVLNTQLTGQDPRTKESYYNLLIDGLNELLAQRTITYDTDYDVIKSHVFQYIKTKTEELNSQNPSNTELKNSSKKTHVASNIQHTKNSRNTREHDDFLNVRQHANVLGNTSLDIIRYFNGHELTIQDNGELYERSFRDKGDEFIGLGHPKFLTYATNIYNFLLKVVNHCTVNEYKLKIKFEINGTPTTSVEKLVKPRNIHIFQVVRQFVEISKDYNKLVRNKQGETYTMTFKYNMMYVIYEVSDIFTNSWGNENPDGVLIEENTTFTGRNRTKNYNGSRPENRWRLKGVKGIWRAYGGTRVARTRGRKIKAQKFTRIRKNKSRKNII
jgi:hypothetical protein